jgi:hypothetical protein
MDNRHESFGSLNGVGFRVDISGKTSGISVFQNEMLWLKLSFDLVLSPRTKQSAVPSQNFKDSVLNALVQVVPPSVLSPPCHNLGLYSSHTPPSLIRHYERERVAPTREYPTLITQSHRTHSVRVCNDITPGSWSAVSCSVWTHGGVSDPHHHCQRGGEGLNASSLCSRSPIIPPLVARYLLHGTKSLLSLPFL